MQKRLIALTILMVMTALTASAGINLNDGTPITNLSGSTGSMQRFQITVPSGQAWLVISTAAGAGDVDLYIRRGSEPTLSTWDHRPYLAGNTEQVLIQYPAPGTYHVMLHGYAGYSGAMLIADYLGTTVPVTTITNGAPVYNIASAQAVPRYYAISVPSGVAQLTVSTSGGVSGTNANLYVKKGAAPTTSSYDAASTNTGNSESVSLTNPAGVLYIMLTAQTAYAGVTLQATYATSGTTTLSNGVPVSGLSGSQGNWRYYQIAVPSGRDALSVTLRGVTGDADVYVKRGGIPTASSYDYRPYLAGSNETVRISRPSSGTWYIAVHAYSNYSSATLTAQSGAFSVLNDYPYGNQAYPCESAVDPWGFYKGQCTSYVAYRANVSKGIVGSPWWFSNYMTGSGAPGANCTDAPNARLSNACYWANRLQNSGLATVSTTPTVGSIAHWSAQGTGALRYGHVAWVEAVHSDGTVTVSEYNYSPACSFSVRERVRADRYIRLN